MIDAAYQDGVFATRAMKLGITLAGGRGHKLVPNGFGKDSSGIVWFVFREDDVMADVMAWREGKTLPIDLHRQWYYYILFRCALHGYDNDLQIVCTLKMLDTEIASDGISRRNGLVSYQYDDDAEARETAGKFLTCEPIEVEASSFWNSLDWFHSNINTAR